MTKNILVIGRRDDREDYDNRTTMLRGLESVSEKVVYSGADYEDLLFSFDGKRLIVIDTVSGKDIAGYDAVFLVGWFKTKVLDDVARSAATYLHSKGIPFANSEAFHGRSFTKLSQCVLAATHDVSVTPFIFCMDQRLLLDHVMKMNVRLPYIAKAVSASRGRDNYLVTDHAQLEAAIHEDTELPRYFIVQTYIPNDGDYRVLVMGDAVRKVIHRKSKAGSHLNNTSQGGSATLVDTTMIPQKVLDDSVLMAKLLRREVTGVDMIRDKDTDQYYFLEANNMPQLATGAHVQAKLTELDAYLVALADGKAARYID